LKSITISQFMEGINRLPSDEPKHYPGKWFQTQKEHWLGWLSEYHTPGAYGRTSDKPRDAAYAYNHIVEYRMLLWIIAAAGVAPELVEQARHSAEQASTLAGKAAAVRKEVPWDTLARALFQK
jgi:hypothetical protein